jgi:hypothetical protein
MVGIDTWWPVAGVTDHKYLDTPEECPKTPVLDVLVKGYQSMHVVLIRTYRAPRIESDRIDRAFPEHTTVFSSECVL